MYKRGIGDVVNSGTFADQARNLIQDKGALKEMLLPIDALRTVVFLIIGWSEASGIRFPRTYCFISVRGLLEWT